MNAQLYEAFTDTLPPGLFFMPQMERVGKFPEIPPTPEAEKDAWTAQLIARIKRDNGLCDGPVAIVGTPTLVDGWVKDRFLAND